MTTRTHRLRSTTFAALLVASLALAAPVSAGKPAKSVSTATAQGVAVSLAAHGVFAIYGSETYQFDEADASSYFTNLRLATAPSVSCTGSPTNCDPANQPTAPAPPAPRAGEVSDRTGAIYDNLCVFCSGGTLTGHPYTQSLTVGGANATKGNWTFTWSYAVAPDPAKDADLVAAGVQVGERTAWDLVSSNGDGIAHLAITGWVAAESVQVSSQFPTGKYSFSLLNADGSSRVGAITLTVATAAGTVLGTYPLEATIESNAPGALAGDVGALDFTFPAFDGMNGTATGALRSGDARTILNSDAFAGNDNGGADGSALARAELSATPLSLPVGDYVISLSGTIKDVATSTASTGFSISESINIITPGC